MNTQKVRRTCHSKLVWKRKSCAEKTKLKWKSFLKKIFASSVVFAMPIHKHMAVAINRHIQVEFNSTLT